MRIRQFGEETGPELYGKSLSGAHQGPGEPIMAIIVCGKCGGTGYCSGCKGTGICGVCNGDGVIPDVSILNNTCKQCDGRGKCNRCIGAGLCSICAQDRYADRGSQPDFSDPTEPDIARLPRKQTAFCHR